MNTQMDAKLFIIVSMLIATTIQFTLPPLSMQIDKPSDCNSTAIYNSLSFSCLECPQSQKKKNLTDCECQSGSINSDYQTIGFIDMKCQKCPTNQVPSRFDNTRCQTCPGAINSTLNECICQTGEAIQEVDENGQFLTSKKCLKCDTDAYQGPYSYECKKCPYGKKYNTQYQCVCDTTNQVYEEAGDTCISKQDYTQYILLGGSTYNYVVQEAIKITYKKVLDNQNGLPVQINSDTVTYNYYKSVVGCAKYKDSKMCQLFGNLCVINLYDPNNPICKLFKELGTKVGQFQYSINDWYVGYPWLRYQQSKNTDPILRDTNLNIKLSYNLEFTANKIDYYVAKFDFDGTFIGIQQMTDELFFCSFSSSELARFKSFGYKYKDTCSFELGYYKKLRPEVYSIYIRTGQDTYYPVPVKIKYVGQSDQYVRKFMLVDNVSAKPNNGDYKNDTVPYLIRFVSYQKFYYRLVDSVNGRIYTPYLELEFEEKMVGNTNEQLIVQSGIETFYDKDTSNLNTGTQVFYGLFVVSAIFLWIIRVYTWTMSNKQSKINNYYQRLLVKAVFIFIDVYGFVLFVYLLLTTLYIFCFFKMQIDVYTNIPEDLSNVSSLLSMRYFLAFFVQMIVCRLISMVYRIYSQCQASFFFIDNEQPRMSEQSQMVSVWRSTLTFNEFSEMIQWRIVDEHLTAMIFLFFMNTVNFDQLGLNAPTMSIKLNNPSLKQHFILRYFISQFMLIVIMVIQLFIRTVFKKQIPLKMNHFINLCCISNVSVLILDNENHGYYIHGSIPGGIADGDSFDLQMILNNDMQQNNQFRGLQRFNQENKIEDANLQTYEVYIPQQMQTIYKILLQLHYDDEISQSIDLINNQTIKDNTCFQEIINYCTQSKQDKFQKQYQIIEAFKKYVLSFINNQNNINIREKGFIQRLFGLPAPDVSSQGSEEMIFYKDLNHEWISLFSCGNEGSNIIDFISIYCLWDLIFQNSVITMCVTYLTKYFIKEIISYFQMNNLSFKSMISQEFFYR